MDNIKIGDIVGWSSMAGYKEGTVKNIILSKNAADVIVPWIDIEYTIAKYRGEAINQCIRMCATQSNLTMMKVTRV
jgi:hypothetical protein